MFEYLICFELLIISTELLSNSYFLFELLSISIRRCRKNQVSQMRYQLPNEILGISIELPCISYKYHNRVPYELCTLCSRFINISDTDELKSKLLDIWPFEKKGYKIISVLGSVKKFQWIVECSVLDTPEGLKEYLDPVC